jgi:hypothetical protein
MNATTSKQSKVGPKRYRLGCLHSRNPYHSPMLVLNMSMFNSEPGWESGWNRIFNQRSGHETSGEHSRLASRFRRPRPGALFR